MDAPSTVGMTDEGVNVPNEGTSTPITEESPPSANQSEEAPADGLNSASEDVLPFGKHPRWIEMTKSNRELKAKLKELSSFEKNRSVYENAINLQNYLTSNPDVLELVLSSMKGQKPNVQSQPEQDPYAEYAPEIQALFKDRDDLKKWRQQQEQISQTQFQQSIIEHQGMIDEAFDDLLLKDGFVDSNGKFDEQEVALLSKATRSFLDEIAKNPHKPTINEMKQAYSTVKTAFKKASDRTLRQAANNRTHVPATGSRSNNGPVPQPQRTAVEEMVEVFRAANQS